LTDLHGFTQPTAAKNGHAARVFLDWLGERASPAALRQLSVADLDTFLAWRYPSLRRTTRRGVSHCLRSFLRYLYAAGHLDRDLAGVVAGPQIYWNETIPSALTEQQVRDLLATTRRDRTAMGRRDYAMILLLATYGLRAGEVVRLQLEDLDWRRERIRIRRSKRGGESLLPLTPAVGETLLQYLGKARPISDRREVFLRLRAPHGPFSRGAGLYAIVSRRLARAGIHVEGKHGPHALRYARAVSLLRAAVPLKTISDILGHRSSASTDGYLKLATEDLRQVGLDLPPEVEP
jgi:site-specific recombinase XerD